MFPQTSSTVEGYALLVLLPGQYTGNKPLYDYQDGDTDLIFLAQTVEASY